MHCSPKESTGEGREFGKTTSDDVFFFMSALISDNGLKGFFQGLNDAPEDPQPELDNWILNLLQT